MFKFRELAQESSGIPLNKLGLRMRSYEEEDREAEKECRRVEKMAAIGESVGREVRIQDNSC